MAAEAIGVVLGDQRTDSVSAPQALKDLAPRQSALPDVGGQKMVLNLDDMCLGLDSEFGAAAFRHVSEAVSRLMADHDRVVTKLRQDNNELQHQLESALNGTPSTPSKFAGVEQQVVDTRESHRKIDCVDESHVTSALSGHVPRNEASPLHIVRRERQQTPEEEDETDAVKVTEHWRARMRTVVRSGKFDSVIGAVIVGNTFVMSMQLEYSGRVFQDEVLNKCIDCGVRTNVIEEFFTATEHVFTAIFCLELCVRLFCEGFRYVCSVSNVLDALVVLVSMADSWVLGPLGNDAMGSVAVLRLMRLMRLAKVLRVVRVMKAFKSLRVLVSAVVNSVGALGWSMTLLFVLELVMAIFMAQVIKPFMEDAADDAELQDFIWKHFGTWTNSMFTIFEITMAPGGFIQYRRLYEDVHPAFGIFFVIYVCVVTFAVVRVITAMFLKATLSASDSDEQNTAREKSLQWSKYMKTLEKKAVGPAGVMDHQELNDLLANDEFREWVEEVGLASYEVTRIFCALDEGDGGVLFAEFEAAITQMRGQPRAADVVINLYETRNILLRTIRMETRLDETCNRLRSHGANL